MSIEKKQLREALEEAGIEVYRADDDQICIAERVRLNLLMDSGVRIVCQSPMRITFVARSQRSDHPHTSSDDHLDRVRAAIGKPAEERGYVEEAARIQEVKDPIDDTKVLDVWHEVAYTKAVDALTETIQEVRWALDVERYVS